MKYKIVKKEYLNTITLNQILEKYPPAGIVDFLNIDVEGKELYVLKSIDLNKNLAKMIMVEQNNNFNQIQKYLKRFNYKLIDKIDRNLVFEKYEMKKAIITGITGQDGSYLAEFLIEKGYEVHGIIRRSSSFNTQRIEHLYIEELIQDFKSKRNIFLHYGDMTDATNLIRLFQEIKPDEVYNLAAQSHVKVSFDLPEYTAETDGIGTLRILEAIRICGLEKKTKIYQASTSELYGKVQEIPQNESTPFYPRSPYGVAKLYAYWITKNYRESYGMFAVNGILFNHESERRGETFVSRKITLAASRISFDLQKILYLGNLDAKRDWGYAKDYVKCMWLMLQYNKPEDFVIATGNQYTVREFVN